MTVTGISDIHGNVDFLKKFANLLKNTDLQLYNWFKESEFFLNWIKEEIYPDMIGKKIADSDVQMSI